MPAAVGRTFTLYGPEAIEWWAIIRVIAKACGTFKLTILVPSFYIRMLAMLLESYNFFPITRDQLTMLLATRAIPRTFTSCSASIRFVSRRMPCHICRKPGIPLDTSEFNTRLVGP
jgi:hypothetical protein